MSATIHRSVSGATLADCEAQLEPGETIVHTVGSRVTGSVVCQVAAAPEASAVAEKVSEQHTGMFGTCSCFPGLPNRHDLTSAGRAECATFERAWRRHWGWIEGNRHGGRPADVWAAPYRAGWIAGAAAVAS